MMKNYGEIVLKRKWYVKNTQYLQGKLKIFIHCKQIMRIFATVFNTNYLTFG